MNAVDRALAILDRPGESCDYCEVIAPFLHETGCPLRYFHSEYNRLNDIISELRGEQNRLVHAVALFIGALENK